MTDETEPRLATRDDYPEIINLLDRVFRYGSGSMPAHIPNWFDESYPEHYAVIEREGQVISTVGCVPQTFVVDGDEIEWWGLGNVATDKHYRGNGYMSALLEFWLDRMRERDVPLVELGGDRKRYNRYGWENAGREITYTISERIFSGGSVDEDEVRRYTGSDADLDILTSVHRAEPLRVKRTWEEFQDLFDQHGVLTLLYEHEGDESYLSFNQEAPSGRYSTQQHTYVVPEFGGTADGLQALFTYLWRHHAIDRIGVPTHPTHHLTGYLREISTAWSMAPHRMVNVLDFESALRGITGQLADRWSSAHHSGSGTVTLSITDADEPPVTVRYTDSDMLVERTPDRDPDIALDRLSMTSLLFGFQEGFRSIKCEEPFLDAVLPVDFYIWKLEGP